MTNPEAIAIVEAAVAEIKPCLAGLRPEIQGCILAELLAIWLSGHFADDRSKTAAYREVLLEAHIDCVRELVPVMDEAMALRQEAERRSG
jgi:hypothetical protein